MNVNTGAVLVQIIKKYREAHPEEAAEADALDNEYRPFSEAEPATFSIPAEEGE